MRAPALMKLGIARRLPLPWQREAGRRLVEIEVLVDEPDDLLRIGVPRERDVGPVLLEHHGREAAEPREPVARVLAALVGPALERSLRADRHFRIGPRRAVEMNDAVELRVLGEDDA